MTFKIIEINETKETMVIEWDKKTSLNHRIPEKLLENPDSLSDKEVESIIESMRPENTEKSSKRSVTSRLSNYMVEPRNIQESKSNSIIRKSKWKYINCIVFEMKTGEEKVLEPEVNGLERTKSFTYITSGFLNIINSNRPDRQYRASDKKIAGGLAFPGKYTIQPLEDSVYKCVSFRNNLDMYDIQEKIFKKNSPDKVYQDWEKALVIRGKIQVNSQEINENDYFTPEVGDNIKSISDTSLVLFSRRKEVINEGLEPDKI